MPDLPDSRHITNALKGIAILIVVSAHIFSNFAEDFYVRWMSEYAISVIAIFFVLSGYGIFESLERRFAASDNIGRTLLKYAFDRAVRIYPLYWLAMILMPLTLHPFYESELLFSFNLKTVMVWLGLPLVRGPMLWFITSIIQCYWVAPVLYFLLKRFGGIKFSLLMVAASFGATFVSLVFYLNWFDLLHIPPMGQPQAFFFKGFFFGNILIFALGMMIPLAASRYQNLLQRPTVMIGSLVFYLAMIYLLRFPSQVFRYSEILLVPLLIFSVFSFCLCAIVYQPRMPLEPFLGLLGRHSYTLYLFHYQFIFTLAYLGLIGGSDYTRSILIALALLPLLLVICIGLDRAACSLQNWLESHIGSRIQARESSLNRA